MRRNGIMTRHRGAGIAAALAAGVIALACPGDSLAQSKTGTAIGQFLRIEPSARHAGMGNAGAAIVSGIEGAYFNPGAIGLLDGPEVEVMRSEWYAGIQFDYLAVGFPLRDWGNLFLSATSLNSGDIAVRTVDQPLGTGEQYTVSNVAIGLGFGRRITDRLAGGVQFTWANEEIWHSSTDFVTFNVGTAFRLNDAGLLLGSSISNLGTRARFDGRDLAILFDQDPTIQGDNPALPAELFTERFAVPILFRVGLSAPYQLGRRNRIVASIDALHPSNNTESMNAGVEWSLGEFLALRGGYQTLFQDDSELGWTFGAGIGAEMNGRPLRLDYGWAAHEHLDATHRIGLILSL